MTITTDVQSWIVASWCCANGKDGCVSDHTEAQWMRSWKPDCPMGFFDYSLLLWLLEN